MSDQDLWDLGNHARQLAGDAQRLADEVERIVTRYEQVEAENARLRKHVGELALSEIRMIRGGESA